MDNEKTILTRLVSEKLYADAWPTAEKIADHLLENGVVIPPCKIGDEAYAIRTAGDGLYAKKSVVSQMVFTHDMRVGIVVHNVARGFWGKDVFATREEAEAEIARRRSNHESV